MSVLNRLNNFIGRSASDEVFYELVANEIEAGNIRKGLQTKALAMTDFDENKAKAIYITMRVELYAVSQLPNHKDPTVIRRYAHLSPDFRKQVTEKTAQLSEGWLSLLRYHQDGTSGKHNQ